MANFYAAELAAGAGAKRAKPYSTKKKKAMQMLKGLGKGTAKEKAKAEAQKAIAESKDAQDAIAEGKKAGAKLGGAAAAKADALAKEKTVSASHPISAAAGLKSPGVGAGNGYQTIRTGSEKGGWQVKPLSRFRQHARQDPGNIGPRLSVPNWTEYT